MDACNLFIQAANGLSTGVFPEVFLDVLFPKAFGFEDLTNINYDSMEKNSDSLLGEVTHIAKSKKLDFKKSLIKSVGEYLKSRGFIYSTEPQTYKSNYDFIRVINDYCVSRIILKKMSGYCFKHPLLLTSLITFRLRMKKTCKRNC